MTSDNVVKILLKSQLDENSCTKFSLLCDETGQRIQLLPFLTLQRVTRHSLSSASSQKQEMMWMDKSLAFLSPARWVMSCWSCWLTSVEWMEQNLDELFTLNLVDSSTGFVNCFDVFVDSFAWKLKSNVEIPLLSTRFLLHKHRQIFNQKRNLPTFSNNRK